MIKYSIDKLFYLLPLFICVMMEAYPQNINIDSLENWVERYPNRDSLYVGNLLELEKYYYIHAPSKFGLRVDEIRQLSNKIDFKKGLAIGYKLESLKYQLKGDYPNALKEAQMALSVAMLYNDPSLVSECYLQLGNLWAKNSSSSKGNSQSEKAKDYFDESLSWAKKTNDLKLIYNSTSHVAFTLIEMRLYDDALIHLKQCLEMNKTFKDLRAESFTLNLFGRVMNIKDKPELAIVYLKKSEKIALKQENQYLLNLVYHHLGVSYWKLNKLTEAEKYFKKSLYFSKQQDLDSQVPTLINLAEVAEDNRDFEAALGYTKEYISIRDSVFSAKSKKDFLEIEAKYEINIKEEENRHLSELNESIEKLNKVYLIALAIFLLLFSVALILYKLLFDSRRVIKEKNKQLHEANEVKNNILKIISHDLKTPANSFVHLTTNINNLIKDKSYKKIADLGMYAQSLANDLQSVVSNLLYWSMLQQGIKDIVTEPVHLEESFQEIKENFSYYTDTHHINLQVSNPSHIVLNSNRVYFNMILRNLISNALKFTPNGGDVRVSADILDEQIQIKIQDTGVGFSSNDIVSFNAGKQLSIKSGTRGEKGTGLGLTICRDILKLLQGSIFIENSQLLSGACVTILLDKKHLL